MSQRDLLARLVEVLQALGVRFMLVGSYGSTAWGEARFTQDIDVVVDLTQDDVLPLVRAFPAPEFYISPDAVQDAVRRRGQFNVIHATSGNKVDFIVVRGDVWGHTQLARRRDVDLGGGLLVPVAAPEDVILGKLEYYREGGSEKHLRDIAGILRVSARAIDHEYLARWAQQLGLGEVWQAVLSKLPKPPAGGDSNDP